MRRVPITGHAIVTVPCTIRNNTQSDFSIISFLISDVPAPIFPGQAEVVPAQNEEGVEEALEMPVMNFGSEE